MKQQRRSGRGRPVREARRRGMVVVVIVLAALAAAALIWLGRPSEPSRVASVPTSANVLGSPAAPVTIEEWGDFQ